MTTMDEILNESTERLMTPSEVAEVFSVNPKTVSRWEKTGRISCIRTLGGHRRFRSSDIRAALVGAPDADDIPDTGDDN